MPARPAATLKRKSSLPVWVSIGWRVLAVLGLLALAVGVHWLERDGLKDTADGHVSFLDILYFTSISVTTTGYGDIVPVSDSARMFDAFVVTPIRVFVVLLFLGTAYNFVLKRTWDKWRMAVIQQTLSGHIIVAGYGTTGSETVDELIARGTDRGKIVVVDPDESHVARAKECGCTVLQADATRDQVLKDVRIENAESMIVCAGRDDTSILITLTARHLAPALPISVIVRNEDNELPARAAGATTVVNPVSFAGLLLAGSCKGPHLSGYLMDLASYHGEVELAERPVKPDEVGKPLAAIETGLGVRIYRGEAHYGHKAPEAQELQAGDLIVEITG
ncbi:potassium channel family protein [Sphingomonas psychrotolerans]|uniref:Potassium channel family protein n=1 Tax=Sphingomonas psychrotolerans TaxID=1327635 RepID=A0ABU3N2D2_9SPHN|nr:potassium channel family protein [Sphingomonas psychrotolerans]MDT8757651.1 potassium channel family protein [Sphingomonas psychrotolerans]